MHTPKFAVPLFSFLLNSFVVFPWIRILWKTALLLLRGPFPKGPSSAYLFPLFCVLLCPSPPAKIKKCSPRQGKAHKYLLQANAPHRTVKFLGDGMLPQNNTRQYSLAREDRSDGGMAGLLTYDRSRVCFRNDAFSVCIFTCGEHPNGKCRSRFVKYSNGDCTGFQPVSLFIYSADCLSNHTPNKLTIQFGPL